jgi:sRNA-binding regulator protein Hfq
VSAPKEGGWYMAESFVVLARQKLQGALYFAHAIDENIVHEAVELLAKAEEQIKWAKGP